MADWKATLNLPTTDFRMKANLQSAEPQAIARWKEMGLYRRIREARQGCPRFILHDGPPYANGRVHLGTALNKVLKDFVVRTRTMAGFDAPYVPGWDCHGLPIELKVDRELGVKKGEMPAVEFRRACRAYATKYVGVQREDFRRLAVEGDWDAPYLTMAPAYQASIVRALGRFVERGMVYKGRKPVHWCIHCRTALAEAEVEYEDHTSPSIHVEFPLDPASAAELAARVPALAGAKVSVLIWTTTPWTIPSNLAVAFHPDFTYGAYPVGDLLVIVAEPLATRVSGEVARPFGAPVATFPGRALEGIKFRHPLYDRESVGVLATYVTLDQGTGAVHTAPGHGADDYRTGVAYGLDIHAPVGAGGHFLESVELFGGLRVFEANPRVEAALDERGRLWHRSTLTHSYPHCWRCHHPVIFLATSQWFIAMDAERLRERAVEAISQVQWVPEWGEERIRGMVENRPDWCISRQRSWGVPIPALQCTSCGEPVISPAIVERAAGVFEQHGADAWYEHPIDEFLPPGLACSACGGTEFERERDILDVWFDSGSSHLAVLLHRAGLEWPADLYLEGQDQYRGWFQSSLLVGIGTRHQAPYRAVVTHGFVVDESGRKMSKSLGNTIEPQEIIAKSGAEILRLWAAMVDFREEVRLGPEILARVIEAYRKIRNTCRILLGNLHGFDPTTDLLPLDQLQPVDRYTLACFAETTRRVEEAYGTYDFPVFFQAINALVTVDLSAFYVDVSKDRLYTLAPASSSRRAAQTTMYLIADGLARLMAPILPVLADEVWQHLPGPREESVHLSRFTEQIAHLRDADIIAEWSRLLEVRNAVNVEIEKLRQQKVIGQSLAAKVDLQATGPLADLLESHRDDLAMLFIASQVTVTRADVPLPSDTPSVLNKGDGGAVVIRVGPADGVKCDRCWRYVPAVSAKPGREGVCPRCDDALDARGA